MLADAINFPLVLAYGLAVLIPLLLFQVGVEGFILANIWHIPFRKLRRFVLRFNVLSLLAGIPTKVVNAFIYAALLPKEITQFFARYALVVSLGTLVYFIVTILVERVCAVRWVRGNAPDIPSGKVWRGILWANLATYVVMAPLHYFATRPTSDIRKYTRDVSWTQNRQTRLLFIDTTTGHLKTKLIGDAQAETVVAAPVKAFLVSTNLNTCVYQGGDGSLYAWRRESALSNLIWRTSEPFFMAQVAFSPSGENVVVAGSNGTYLEIVHLRTGLRLRQELKVPLRVDPYSGPQVAWTQQENRFLVAVNTNRQDWVVTINGDGAMKIAPLEGADPVPLLSCYIKDTRESGFGRDDCGDLHAWTFPGLGSSLRIYQKKNGGDKQTILNVAVDPGLLHLGRFSFRDAAFLPGCQECLVSASETIYLIDIQGRRLGSVASGKQFIILTPKFLKKL